MGKYTCEGLPSEGVLVSDIREVTETTVCQYFGPKSSKSGWRYQSRATEEEQDQILSLYRKVYGAEEPPNKEITLSFARGLILMSQGESVNWSQFAAERKKVREAMRKKLEGRKEMEREREAKGSESTLSGGLFRKKRGVGEESGNIGRPGSLTLTVKSEGIAEGLGMGRKSIKKGMRSVIGPCWEREEVESMRRAIEYHEGLYVECKNSAVESRKELEAVEDKLRRQKLLLSDRQAMLDEVKLRLKNIDGEELLVKAAQEAKLKQMDAYSLGLIEGTFGDRQHGDPTGLQREISDLKTQTDALSFKKASDELTVRLCVTAISGCTEEIALLEQAVTTSAQSFKKSESSVFALDSVLGSMREQLQKMEVGDGACVYPRPSENSPQQPVVELHRLNACPLCSLWYENFDYSALACGHTYHPFCLYVVAQRSSECLVVNCKEPCASKNLAALGLRPSSSREVRPKLMICTPKDAAGKTSTETESGPTIGAPTSPTPSWARESPTKMRPLSQSSQNDVSSKPLCVPEPTEKKQDKEMCEICKKKEASVFLKGCGHDVFCLLCIQGLKLCPICGGSVTGWGRNHAQPKPTPFFKAARHNSGHGRRDPTTEKTLPEEEDSDGLEKEATKVGDDFESSDDSDSDKGFIHWCGSDEFRKGGARSGQDYNVEEEDTESEEDEELPREPKNGNKKTLKSRFAAVSTLLQSSEGEQEELEHRGNARKRSRSKCPTDNHIQKFKKIVEMAAEENSGPMPGGESQENPLCEAADVPRKKRLGRPPKAAKVQGKKKPEISPVTKQSALMKEDSQLINRCRTTPRRRELPLDAIPVKFRGL